MLPPVRATLSSFADYQTQSQQPMLRQRIDVANNAASTGTIASAPLSGGRLDILSLSTQLQLAQGVSIFAETIGKLIQLPRREGEALLDYAKRLSEAVKAMNPVERAALERMLNQIVKGVSLRLLAEVLNNPAGPDAARFAMRMETAQLLDLDLAAKAVVSSYRQNAGAEQAPGLPPKPANTVAVPPDQPAGTGASSAAAADAQDAPQTDEAGFSASLQNDADVEIAGNGEASMRQAASPAAQTEAMAPAHEPAALPANMEAAIFAASDEGALVVESATGSEVTAATAVEQEVAAELAESETADLLVALADEMPEDPPGTRHVESGARDGARPASAEGRTPQPVFYDGPALARLSQRAPEQTRPALITDKTTVGAMAEWLAEALGDGNVELLEPLPATAKPLPEQQALEELADGEFPARLAPQTEEVAASLPKPAVRTTTEPEGEAPAARSAIAPANTNSQPGSASELAEQLALPLPLPHALREGVPLPYVPYPPEERERDPEERKTREVSKTDEDGEEQHSPGEQAFHEDKPAEDQKGEPDEDAAVEDAEDAGRANDLYWRMAGWA